MVGLGFVAEKELKELCTRSRNTGGVLSSLMRGCLTVISACSAELFAGLQGKLSRAGEGEAVHLLLRQLGQLDDGFHPFFALNRGFTKLAPEVCLVTKKNQAPPKT
jgi:hypothetical protein